METIAADIQNFVLNFLSIVWEALPFIILGALIAGILEELLPQQALSKLLPKHFLPAVLIGGALGLVFPMCECGIVVVMRRLLKKGLPLSCCVAYMLAGPIVNPIVLGSTAVAFFPHEDVNGNSLGWPVVLMRAGIGYVVACITGLVVHYLTSRLGEKALLTPTALPPQSKSPLSLTVVEGEPAPQEKRSVWQRVSNISSTALNDFIDITVFLIIGSILSALVKSDPRLIQSVEEMSRSSPVLAIPLLMLLAFVLCLCSEADAFLAASFKTMSVSAKMAFLVFGPMLDIKLVLMYTRVFRTRLILSIIGCVTILVFAFTLASHWLYNPQVLGAGGGQSVSQSLSPDAGTQPTTEATEPSK